MSQRLPQLSGKQVIAALKADGWYIKRIHGSHHIMRHPTALDAIPVPVHGNHPVKQGTLHSIIRTAGLSRKEFLKLL